MKKAFYLALGLILAVFYLNVGGCGNKSITDSTSTASSSSAATGAAAPAALTMAMNPSSGLSALGKAAVAVTVKTAAGANVADGTLISFSVNSASLGTITPSATTVSGVATATFTAANVAGTAVVTATAGGVSQTASITILGADVGSIQFVSASPNVIGIKGSGQQENSIVTFSVQDVNGQPVSDGTNVTFTLSGPNGGEKLTTSTTSTSGGLAKTTLQSGVIAGPVRVNASTVVKVVTISSSSTGVSIGGGLPSMTAFTLTTTSANLAGLTYADLTATISVFLADRAGNFNVLTGTSVSFYAESGAIDRSNVTNANGVTTVQYRTQNPPPQSPVTTPAPVLISALLAPPVNITGNALDGIATIIAVTRGEECFQDVNGNGVFDPGIDIFPPSCDLGEPYIDVNGNGQYDPGEFYIDANNDGQYTGKNSVWDGNILIWKAIPIAITTQSPSQIKISSPAAIPFAIANGGSQAFNLCVADVNGNSIMAGSTIDLQADKGTLAGKGTFTLPDIGEGPYCLSFSLADTTAGTTASPPDPSNITITVTSKVPNQGDLVTTRIISGTIQ